MNKQTRKALIESITSDFNTPATSPDHFVVLATRMADAASQGRTERWKAASRNAGEVILDQSKRGLHTFKTTREAVRQGLDLMTEANK